MALDNVEDIYPLSPVQAGMLFHYLDQPDTGVYIGQMSCELHGQLDNNRLHDVWTQLSQRHSILRTSFVWEEMDQPLQIVHKKVDLDWTLLDFSELSSDEQNQRIQTWKHKDSLTGFDLLQAPVMRLNLLRLAAEHHLLVWTTHHAIADGWSYTVLMQEMLTLYASDGRDAASTLPSAFDYSRYIAWLTSRDLQADERYWRQRLHGFKQSVMPALAPPNGQQNPAGATQQRYDEQHLDISLKLSQEIQKTARELHISPNILFQAVWGIVLHRYSGQDDIVFGVTTSGRTEELSGIENAVGLFINTLPTRQQITHSSRVSDWLQQLQRESVDFSRHQATPLSKAMEWSDVSPGEKLFDSIMIYTSYPSVQKSPTKHTLRIGGCSNVSPANYALTLVVTPDEQTQLKLIYDKQRYAAGDITHLLNDVNMALQGLTTHPQQAVEQIQLHCDADQDAMQALINGPALEQHPAESVLNDFQRIVQQHPDQLAVTFAGQQLSYAELNQASLAGATQLIHSGIQPGSRVGLCMSPSIEMITAILAILRAGAAYVPLDPEYPKERLRHLLDDSGIDMVVVDAPNKGLISSLGKTPLELSSQTHGEALALPTLSGHQTAYIIYTSGSSGGPKGVPISHANLAYSTAARQQHYQQPPSAFLLLSSFAFDSSVAGIFWTLCNGGTLVLTERRAEQDMATLGQLIAQHQVSHTLCLPSLYQALLNHIAPADLQSLSSVIVAGEALSRSVVASHYKVLPKTRLFNEYGPTEGTVWCSVAEVMPHATTSIPIGRPIPGSRLYLLDQRGRPTPRGTPGEITLAGPGVTAGYLQRPQLTRERFIPEPQPPQAAQLVTESHGQSASLAYRSGDYARYDSDGNLHFLGRQDDQIKLRGHRIELHEIESALNSHPQVEEAVVIVDATQASMDADPQALIQALQQLDQQQAQQLLSEVEDAV